MDSLLPWLLPSQDQRRSQEPRRSLRQQQKIKNTRRAIAASPRTPFTKRPHRAQAVKRAWCSSKDATGTAALAAEPRDPDGSTQARATATAESHAARARPARRVTSPALLEAMRARIRCALRYAGLAAPFLARVTSRQCGHPPRQRRSLLAHMSRHSLPASTCLLSVCRVTAPASQKCV